MVRIAHGLEYNKKDLELISALINLGPRFIAEKNLHETSFNLYCIFHTSYIRCKSYSETITAAKDVDSLFPFEVSNTRWGTDSPLLTVTVKNYAQKHRSLKTQNQRFQRIVYN